MNSVFSKIIKRELPAYIVAEDEKCIAFLDINPVQKGHTLVVPKSEIDYIFDIPDDLYSHLFLFSKKVAIAIKNVIPCKRIGVAIVGLEIPHAHIHLIPINRISDIDFSKKLSLSHEEMNRIAKSIDESFKKLFGPTN